MTDMTMTDATILASLLTELRLPSIARNWKRITEAANREGWPAQKTLATLLEIEVAERASRRIQRHRDQSETPVGKTFASFDFTAAPELSKPHDVMSRPGDGLTPYSPTTVAIVLGAVNNGDRTPEMRTKRVRDMKGKQYHLGWRHTPSAEARARMSAAQSRRQAREHALGRPKRRNEPWLAAGVSKSTSYRRRAERD